METYTTQIYQTQTVYTQINNESASFCTSHRNIFHILQDKYSIICLILGTFGNLMSFLVLLQAKMRIHSTFTYLTVLSICDLFVIYIGLLRDYLILTYDIQINGTLLCKFHVFCFYFLLHMSSWLLVAVNIDRLIAASCLTFSKLWCTPRRAICVILCLAIVLASINSHFLYYVEALNIDTDIPVNPYVYKKCIIKAIYNNYNSFFQNIFTWIDTTAQVILPFLIMLFCNVNIIQKVLITNKKIKGKNLKRLRKIKGMCIMIVSLSCIFFVLELPVLIFICLLQASWISIDSPCTEILWILTNMMMYTNHASNFFLYCMTGSAFRQEVIKLFSIQKYWNYLKFQFSSNKQNFNVRLRNNHNNHHHNQNNNNNTNNKFNSYVATRFNNTNYEKSKIFEDDFSTAINCNRSNMELSIYDNNQDDEQNNNYKNVRLKKTTSYKLFKSLRLKTRKNFLDPNTPQYICSIENAVHNDDDKNNIRRTDV